MRNHGVARTQSNQLRTLLLIATSVAMSYWFVVASLARQWIDDPNYNHGLFVVPLAAILVWRRRKALAEIPPSTASAGLPLLLAGIAMYVVGVAAAELFTMRVSLIVNIAALVLLTQGWRRLRVLAFPIAFLFFMVPLPYLVYYKITFPLQLFSSQLASGILSAMGMPVVRAGNVIHLEQYVLEVVTACSGLRSMMTLGAMAVFLLDFLHMRAALKVLFVAAVIPVAVLANTARLTTTAVLSAVGGTEMADSFLHELSGVAVFLLGLLMLLVLGRILEWVDKR